jgi:nodulation protein E
MGVVSPLGTSVAPFAESLREGRSAIAPIANITGENLTVAVGAQVHEDIFTGNFDPKEVSLLDRTTQLVLLAGRQAIGASGLKFDNGLGPRSAVVIGTGAGAGGAIEENYYRLYVERNRRAHPMVVPRVMLNAPASHLTMEFGISGPSFVVASACASANHAIGLAFHMVRSGMVDVAVTGGAEACMTYGCLKGWEALRVMAPDTCRPFSRERLGMVMGEGSGVFVLERMDLAKARDADILAELLGWGMSSDASNIVLPTVEGPTAAMRGCLRDARLDPERVDYINAHGTGTLANDVTETRAIHSTLGDHAHEIFISSTKSMHGHALGGSGALELAAVVSAIRGNFVPPTQNYLSRDPDCDLDYVPNETRDERINVALSNSFAFGGHNAVLAVGRFAG